MAEVRPLGRDAEFPQCVAHSAGIHRLARAAAGEQPGRVLVDGRGVGGQGVEVVEPVGGHRLGQWGGRVAEPECDELAVVEHVVDDHADWGFLNGRK